MQILEKKKCQLYRDVMDIYGQEVKVISVLKAIRDGRWKDRIDEYRYMKDRDKAREFKLSLPAATFSGTFNKRYDNDINEYNHIIALDVDQGNIQEARNKLMEDDHCFAFFFSPSYGLKILVEVDLPHEYHTDYAFPQLEEHYDTKFGITIDPSGKNLSRLCFISYDPELVMKDSNVFEVDATRITEDSSERKFKRLINTGEIDVSNDVNHIFEVCLKWTRKNQSNRKGNRNNFMHELGCNLNRCGVDEYTAMQLIVINNVNSLSHKEIINCISAIYKRNQKEHATRDVYKKRSRQNKLF